MKNNKILKRFLAFLLTAAMTLTYMPMAASWFAYAGDGDNDQVQLEQQVKAETSTGSEESSAEKEPSKEEVATDQTIESVEDAAESKESKTSEDTSEEVNGAASEKVEEASDKAKEEASDKAKEEASDKATQEASDKVQEEASDKAQEEASEQVEETAEDEAAEAVAGELTAVEEGSYKITVKYDESAGIPEGAELEVKEIKSGGLKFWNYNRKAKKAVEGTDEMLDTDVTSSEELNRFFDISIVVDGKEIEPESAVEVNISYDDPINLSEGQELQVVHFADEGTEVITPEVNGNEITFSQESFSVTGTVVANLNDENNLVLIAEANGKYYEVRYDGSLKEVSFDGTTMTVGSEVEIDMAERWNRSQNRLRVSANNTYTYISPTAASGLSATSTTLTYNNNLLSATAGGTTYYLGVNEAGTAITGQNEQADAARFYLATVPTPTGNTVDHIDIAVQATASVSVPLAYGPYYDASGTQILMVEQGQAVNAKGTNSDIPITQDDLKGSTVSSYTGDHVPLNNFVITSFTVSEQTGEPDQVRYNGTFPVGTSASSADKVYYNVDVTKPVELTLTYDTDGDGEYETLYDMDGQKLVVTVVTSLDASFDYWDSRNECPGILNSWQVNQWRQGQFVTGNGGGMDFRLGTSDESDATLTAIEIVKTLVDENGDTITLPEDEEIVFNFGIYQDPDGDVTAPTAWSGETTAAIDYSGYSTNDSRTVTVGSSGMGLAYDYDVVDGMTYIKETGAVPQTITDADGVTRKYDRTYITTEYVWRDDNGKTHSNVNQSDTMSSIPEVVGDYYYLDSDGKTITSWTDDDGKEHDLHNTFLEFYVYNVYVPETTEATFKKEWSPSAPNGATVEFTLYDDGEATNYKVTLDGAADTTVPTSAGGYESAAWTAKFVNLPNDGSTYTAVETGTYTGYTASGSPASDGGTITNTQDTGDLEITKTITGLPEGEAPANLKFTVTGPNNYSKEVAYSEFTNGKYTITGLPVGTYTVTESGTDYTNYTLAAGTETEKTASVTKGGKATAAFTNAYTQDPGSLKITKTITGLPEGEAPANLKFTVTGPNNYSKEVAYSEFTNGEYTITGLPVGTYTVTESGTDYTNYTLAADTETEKTATVASNATATAAFTNAYTQDTGSVKITKTFAGLPAGTDTSALSFSITIGDETRTVTYADFKNGEYLIEDLPVGTKVTVTETNAEDLVVGYELVADKATTSGEATVEKKDQEAEIALENPYEQIKTEASVIKVWDDNDNAEGMRPESLKVTLSNGVEVTLNEENGWSAKVTALPKYNKDGSEINYTWSESSLPEGYTLVSSTKDGTVTTLTNKYTAPDKGVVSFDPPVQKIIEGTAPKKAETYTFKLEADSASFPMPKAAGGKSSMTMTIKGEGVKEFGKIEFAEPGVYTYKVTEVAGSNSDCEYDDTVYTVRATVDEDSNNKLHAQIEYFADGVAYDVAAFEFVNTYPNKGVKTGDDSGIMGLLALMSASAVGLAALCIRRRREDQ